MDELQKLLQDDLPRLGTYFLDMTTVQGDGVLLVNYYPNDAIAQMEAKFLKASAVPRYARQMGLADLPAQFEAHNRQTQMVVAVVTPETKGTVTVEVSSTSPVPEPEPETPPAKSAATKAKAKGKTPTRTTAKAPVEPEASAPPAAEPEPETPPAKPAKPATRHKARRNPNRTTARRRKTT
jgi:type IV secretory pathway VirB10-like protein